MERILSHFSDHLTFALQKKCLSTSLVVVNYPPSIYLPLMQLLSRAKNISPYSKIPPIFTKPPPLNHLLFDEKG